MNHTAESAFEFIKTKRSSVKPNSGFMAQLLLYEQNIKKNQENKNNDN